MQRLAIVSDIHYAGPRESRHGRDFEFAGAPPSFARALVRLYRRHIWMNNALAHNSLLDRFLERTAQADWAIAAGDYTCDAAGVGVSNDDACESVQLCLGKLRARFGDRLLAIPGDHELGKTSLLGDHGGLRLASWQRMTHDCALRPFWQLKLGAYVLLGITSTLVALPLFQADALPAEWPQWEALRAAHLDEIRAAFDALARDQRVVLFCHDPTALPRLWQEPAVRERVHQITATVVGHLHTRLVFWKSRLLAGIPPVRSLGISVQRMTSALHEARQWRPFKVHLCPALAGIELTRRGGFLTVDLDETGVVPPLIHRHAMPREN
ncbi:MAG TPA: metallophosphoesterase [Verrucomicrobiae bacterium]|nr:metallophosphoesterase [Verrucomicrobiae bacterium]